MPFPRSPGGRRGHGHLVLAGDIGAADCSLMRARMLAALEGPAHNLTVDMRRVRSLSTQAMGVLIGAGARQESWGKRLTLICAQRSPAARSLRRAGMRGTLLKLSELPESRRGQRPLNAGGP
jgi:anti-anti-sigma regulatory factor